MDSIRQALGFTPAAVNERYSVNSRLMNRQRRIMDQRSGLMREAGDQVLGGSRVSASVIEAIQEFNRLNPDYPITSDSLRRSMSSRQSARRRNEFGIQLNPRLNRRLRDEEAELLYD